MVPSCSEAPGDEKCVGAFQLATMTPDFLPELIRDANEVERLTMPERAALMVRAANTIRDYRDQIAFSGTPANDHPGDLVHELREMARLNVLFSAEEVAGKLLEAAEMIRDLRIILRKSASCSSLT